MVKDVCVAFVYPSVTLVYPSITNPRQTGGLATKYFRHSSTVLTLYIRFKATNAVGHLCAFPVPNLFYSSGSVGRPVARLQVSRTVMWAGDICR